VVEKHVLLILCVKAMKESEGPSCQQTNPRRD
jgi:hypothetical protein